MSSSTIIPAAPGTWARVVTGRTALGEKETSCRAVIAWHVDEVGGRYPRVTPVGVFGLLNEVEQVFDLEGRTL